MWSVCGHPVINANEGELQKLIQFAVDNIKEYGRIDQFLNFLSNVCSDLLPGDTYDTMYPSKCPGSKTRTCQVHSTRIPQN